MNLVIVFLQQPSPLTTTDAVVILRKDTCNNAIEVTIT